MSQAKDVIKVSAEAGKRVMVHAKGNPAKIVAVGTAAAIVVVGVGVGYGTYVGARAIKERFLGPRGPEQAEEAGDSPTSRQ